MEARVTLQSQSFRLRERMEEANISHGQKIRAKLPKHRVPALAETGERQAPLSFVPVLYCPLPSSPWV